MSKGDTNDSRRIRTAVAPKKKSTSPSAQNVPKSLIGEAWTKCCSIPTTSTDPIFSIPARKSCIKTLPPRACLSDYLATTCGAGLLASSWSLTFWISDACSFTVAVSVAISFFSSCTVLCSFRNSLSNIAFT
jgi:hypothetical protein